MVKDEQVLAITERDGGARAQSLLLQARQIADITSLQVQTLYFLQGDLSDGTRRALTDLLCEPLTQVADWQAPEGTMVEVAFRPGVTDPVAEQLLHAAQRLGLQDLRGAGSGVRYLVEGPDLDRAALQRLALQLWINPVVQRYALGRLESIFEEERQQGAPTETIPLTDLDDAGLLQLSADRRCSLDLHEMRAVQAYFRGKNRQPSDGELETIAQTWSEHCVHKTFKALIEVENADGSISQIDSLMGTYLKAVTQQLDRPWVLSAFVDNAGILRFDDQHEISIKVETHNHPSAIEPFGGANTGLGGVVRDILGVSARPIAATDVLCFGPLDLGPEQIPEGVIHPRRIFEGVVAGIEDYGNKLGVPVVNGAIQFHPGYLSNPLVYCGCLGIAPRDSHPRQPNPGDRVMVLGGRTGRDGLRGATFSSMTMDAQTGEVAGASVQIGNPVVEKGLIEVITAARDAGLYSAVTDCGAGGLSSAVGEMAEQAGGASVDLTRVLLKYPGLAPWEIWLSEAQERMVVAVPPDRLEHMRQLCDDFEVEHQDVGSFNQDGRLLVTMGEESIVDLELDFLHHGIPRRRLRAKISPPQSLPQNHSDLLELLRRPTLTGKDEVFHRYDHEVLGQTVVRPYCGVEGDGPTDGAVLKPLGTGGERGIVVACGLYPEMGLVDPYEMALWALDEAVRNAVACGADPDQIAVLDNFCWGDPKRPKTLGALIEACRGCHDAALHYGTPFVSGKDSLNNEYIGPDGQRCSIPPTLLITALGIIPDIGHATTPDLKQEGNLLFRLGNPMPAGSLDLQTPDVYRALHCAMQEGLIRSCHDLSQGGIAVALAEMCIGGRIGAICRVEIDMLFQESKGCLIVEVEPARREDLLQHFQGLTAEPLGTVGGTHLMLGSLSYPLEDLVQAWKGGLQ